MDSASNSASNQSQSSYPYLRRAELYISNIPGGGNVKIVGDGTTEHLRIKFEVVTQIQPCATPSCIDVFNLSKELRDRLAQVEWRSGKSKTFMELKVGWENVPVATIFIGDVLAAYSERQEADIVTTLLGVAGWGAFELTHIANTFGAETPVKSAVKNISSQMPGVTTGEINIPEYKFGKRGYSDTGSAKEVLTTLARNYGFSPWIHLGKFNAITDGEILSGATPLLSYKNGYLKRVEPVLAAPLQRQAGVSIQSLINTSVVVGGSVQVESSINPKLSGKYQIHEYHATGDTHGNDWDLRLNSLLYGKELEKALAP